MPYAEEGSEKKKKKFWEFFRRRRKTTDTSSEDEDDAKKRGFLGRKKKDRGSKDVTNSFLINPVIRTDLKTSAESVRSNNSSEMSGRRRIKAKVEASRELLAQGSSSDEGSSYTSYTSSMHSGGSFPRRSRAARTERHNRRMSRDMESKVNKWTANIVYQESKDYDTKYRAKARSATPSPVQSPKVQRASARAKCSFNKSTSTDSLNGMRAPPTPPPRKEPRPQSLALSTDTPKYYPPVYTAPSHMIQARLRQSSQKSLSEQYLARMRMENNNPPASPRPTSPRAPVPRAESTSSMSSESFGKKEELRPLSVVTEKAEISDMDCRRPPHPPHPQERHQLTPDRHQLTPDRHSLTSDRHPLTPDRHPLTPDRRPLTPDRRPLTPDRRPITPDRRPLTPERRPLTPDRRPSRQCSLPVEMMESRKHSSNLEEALNELEAIYKKLSYDECSYDASCNGEALPTDDMAYRRLNKREPSCQDVREIMSQAGSYLLVSPTLSPPPIICHSPPEGEPDITYDDVVYRSVHHSNNTLKVQDPQPPFGIPLGPITPASNTDYLHVRPRLVPSGSSPDLVFDDLAFRNLRKDHYHSKKKAVRSLSANLSGVINRNYINNNNLNVLNNNLEERSHSYNDIPEEMRLAQRVLDMRRNRRSPRKEEPRQVYRQLSDCRNLADRDTEFALLEQLAAETRAASDQIDRELRQLSGPVYTRSMTDLLQEMTHNLNYDFGCQTCSKEQYQRDPYRLQPPTWYNRPPMTRPGSIGPPRPRNPFKEEPWGRRRELKRQSPVNGESMDDDVFLNNCDNMNGPGRGSRDAEDACRNIRDAASGLCRLEKEQEECAGACERVNMVVTATHNMKDSKEERMARYKEERRRALAAQFGPRDTAPASPRTTRASRLRTQANAVSENLISKTTKDEEDGNLAEATASKKEKDKSAKRKSYLNRSHTSEPTPPSGDNGQRRRSGLITSSVSSICASAVKKTSTNQTSSPIPKSSQLVRNQLISSRKNERGSTPESDTNSNSWTFGKRTGSLSSPLNLSPSHKNVRGKHSSGSVSSSSPASPAKTPHSILKRHEEQSSPHHSINLPISILKRKTSNDETTARCASPVRFSPSVVERKGRGILKKHRSLDDPQLESHSLQDSGDEKNNKNGDRRRCSLEEVSRRSPEPQGILKRKASREETEPAPPEPPQSILKRRSSPLVSSESLSPEPILKRKDELPAEPRPILKKKSSSEEEEHSVRPILKDSPARRPTAEIRPILKQQTEDSVIMRPRLGRMYPMENRLSLDAGLLRRLEEPRSGRPLSVAERVLHMETGAFTSLDGVLPNPRAASPTLRMDEEEYSKGLERSGSVSERASLFAEMELKEKQAAEAAKARRLNKGIRQRGKVDGGRFSTQPVTVTEVEQAKRNNDPSSGDDPSKLSLADRVALFAKKEQTEKKAAPAPPPPRRISQPAPHLVEGLMKNLTEKSGVRVPLLPRRFSNSSTSSESDGGLDEHLSPSREITRGMGEVRTLRRCATQPISSLDETDEAKPLTIAERLAALKKNGHSNWMKRISRASPEEELLSTKPPLGGGTRFSEKLEQLETAAEGWKSRVVAPDSHQFSVAGKMGQVAVPQPALGGANRTPTPQVFTPSQGIGSMSTPSVPDSLAALMKRSISVPEGKENEPTGDAPVIKVPAPYDEDFSSFFLSPDIKRLTTIGEVDVADLEHISSQTSHLSVVKRNVRVVRKHRSTNPLKALAQRSDLKTEYIEVKSGVADREIRRMNIEKCNPLF